MKNQKGFSLVESLVTLVIVSIVIAASTQLMTMKKKSTVSSGAQNWTQNGNYLYPTTQTSNVGIGTTTSGYPLQVVSATATAIVGNSTNGIGVYGNSTSGSGIYGSSSTGNAGYFNGNVNTTTGYFVKGISMTPPPCTGTSFLQYNNGWICTDINSVNGSCNGVANGAQWTSPCSCNGDFADTVYTCSNGSVTSNCVADNTCNGS